MKRAFTILVFALVFSNFATAQLADGSIGPDFTATDINGNTHNLYELLDAGKSVILDISATWCGPCWDYHIAGELEAVWEEYGPDGTDEMYVFMIEGDGSTTQADLEGTTTATAGNWITGTQYPIIDNAAIANDYEITYFPTVYHICPNKIVTEIGQVNAAAHHAAHGNCPAWVQGNNNVAAAAYSGTNDILCGTASAITPKLTIRNMGNTNLTSCVVEFMQDGNSMETVNWSGDLATLETDEITFGNVDVLNSSQFSFSVTMPNGTGDEAASDNSITAPIGVNEQSSSTVFFEITTDFWPEEISWELKDNNGDVLYSNADEGALSCDETYNQMYELNIGECYTFSALDGYGDGVLNGVMNPGHGCTTTNGTANMAMGAIKLWSDNGIMWENIDYGNGFDVEFIVASPSATQEVELNGLNIYPNPATDNITVAFELPETTKLEVALYNVLGQQVTTSGTKQYPSGSNNLNVNTADLSTGIYFISITEGEKVTSRKVSILK